MGTLWCSWKGGGGRTLGQAPEWGPQFFSGGGGHAQRLCTGEHNCNVSHPRPGPQGRAGGAVGGRDVRLRERSSGPRDPGQEKGLQQGSRGAGRKPGVFGAGAAVHRGGPGRFGIPSTPTSHTLWGARLCATYLTPGSPGLATLDAWTWDRMAGGLSPGAEGSAGSAHAHSGGNLQASGYRTG